jgi:hypothetical protein
MTTKHFKYDERNVAFIDILGFKEMVNISPQDLSQFHAIFDALQVMKSMKGFVEGANSSLKPQVSLFSDNIVISYLENNEDSMYNLILDCIFLYISLLIHGIFVRGGISKGQLYHDDKFVVGPALIRAYEIESKYSIYPRIVVDDSDYYSDITGSVFKRDFDGLTYIDPIGNFEIVSNAFTESSFEVFSKIHSIVTNKKLTKSMGVNAKLQWLKQYCNQNFQMIEYRILTLNKPRYEITPNSIKLLDEEDFA